MKTASLHQVLICGACSWLAWATPSEARFLQVDPVGYKDQRNLYAYVANDPLNMNDPSGLETKTNCEGVSATCAVTAHTGATFGARDTVAANMRDAQLAMAPITRDLAASTGNELLNVFEINANGSVTPSVSVSDNTGSEVEFGFRELLALTDNPGGDQHGHLGLAPGVSYENAIGSGDADVADGMASRQNRPYDRTVIDGPTGRVISIIGQPGRSTELPNGQWQRRADAPTALSGRVIGRVTPIPYRAP